MHKIYGEVMPILEGNVIEVLGGMDANSVDCIITSPPYWGLRSYGEATKVVWEGDKDCKHKFGENIVEHDNLRYRGDNSKVGNIANKEIHPGKKNSGGNFCSLCGAWYGQLGLEPTLELFISHTLQVTAELYRVLKPSGTLWWNHGDSYCGSGKGKDPKYGEGRDEQPTIKTTSYSPKCLYLQNFRLILKMIDEQGWILRNTIVWHKPNHKPTIVRDRFSTSYEPVFLLSKSKRYWFDLDAVRELIQYPEDVARRMRQDKESGVNPFKKGTAEARHSSAYLGKFKDYGKEAESYGRARAERYGGLEHPTAENLKQRTAKARAEGLPHDMGCSNPAGKNPGDVWKIPTQPFREAHFATFPQKLVRRCILAGCPKEVCKKCGKARVRITEQRELEPEEWDEKLKARLKIAGADKDGRYKGQAVKNYPKSIGDASDRKRRILKAMRCELNTIGFTDCGCGEGFRPGVVLDPFSGAGTTLLVAKKLCREGIGIELNPEYIKLAEKRIANVQRELL